MAQIYFRFEVYILFKKTLAFFHDHPAICVSLVSLYLMSLSYFNAFNLLENYGVNLSGYIFVEDLLILMFRDSYLIGFLFTNLAIFVLFYIKYIYKTQKGARRIVDVSSLDDEKLKSMTEQERNIFIAKGKRAIAELDYVENEYSRSKSIGVLAYLILSFSSANIVANWEFTDIQQGKGEIVKIKLKKDDSAKLNGIVLNKILATSKYIFLENPDTKSTTKVIVIPYANVNYIYSGILGETP